MGLHEGLSFGCSWFDEFVLFEAVFVFAVFGVFGLGDALVVDGDVEDVDFAVDFVVVIDLGVFLLLIGAFGFGCFDLPVMGFEVLYFCSEFVVFLTDFFDDLQQIFDFKPIGRWIFMVIFAFP
jgi:hypothetical protein